MIFTTDSNWLVLRQTPAGDPTPLPYVSVLENWQGRVRQYDPVQIPAYSLSPVPDAPTARPHQYAKVKDETLLILGKFQSGLYLLKREKTGQFIVAPTQSVTLIAPTYSYPANRG